MIFTDLSAERVVRALRKAGFEIDKQGKHVGMTDGRHWVTIPRHKRLNPFTLKGIIKDAGLTSEEFKKLL